MNRFERSWLLFRSSLSVIARNKELLIFPIFITIATAVIMLFFLVPVAVWPTGHPVLSAEHWKALGHAFFAKTSNMNGGHQYTYSPIGIAYVVFLYFVSMFVATFFNVAFYNEILAALSGQPVSLARGLQYAASRWKAILMWSLFAGLIGLIIRAIEERSDFIGRIVMGLIGLAWSIASVFVIPVIVRHPETSNPVAILKQSASILRNAWGEGLIGFIGMRAINGLVMIPSAILIVGAGVISAKLNNFWLLGLTIAGCVVCMIIWSYLMNVAGLVYKGALYMYAAEGVVSKPYDQQMLDSAWKFRR
jgi:hypothetical protein